MVTIINSSRSLYYAIMYNEQKVLDQEAICLEAAYYPIDVGQLTIEQKLSRFRKLAALNQRAKATTITITLNFAPGENLSPELLKEITEAYLKKIGFSEQPYLLYQHLDAGHPHVHVVTTTLKPDGSTILMHDVRTKVSPKARREIEIAFGLRRADRVSWKTDPSAGCRPGRKVMYGQKEITAAIAHVLENVVCRYRCTSIEELNGLLYLYQLRAYAGKPGSLLRANRGLLYQALHPGGKPVGVPVKSSTFGRSFTLTGLEKKFAADIPLKAPLIARLNTVLQYALLSAAHNFPALQSRLGEEGVDLVLLKSNSDKLLPEQIVFVDHRTQSVFRASELRFSLSSVLASALDNRALLVGGPYPDGLAGLQPAEFIAPDNQLYGLQHFLLLLCREEVLSDHMDPGLKRTRRKKKRWYLSDHR